MATVKDLPCELLYYILFLLAQSSSGAEDFARTITVCKKFLLYAQDASILKVVNFNLNIEPVNFYHFHNVKGLLVKCSEAGNVAARHLLGKVLLLSSTQLILSKWKNIGCIPSDLLMFHCAIHDLNVSALNSKVGSFMTYFSPSQVDSSGSSTATRLVHFEVVKLFLLNGSHNDFIKMGVFLKYYIEYLTGDTNENSPLLTSIKLLASRAHSVGSMEKLLKTKEIFSNYFRVVRNYLEAIEQRDTTRASSYGTMTDGQYGLLLNMYMLKCAQIGVHWREPKNDINFVDALREDVMDRLDAAYIDFCLVRAVTVDCFEHYFG